MTAFDPSLERTTSLPALRDEREVAMLKHDLGRAMADVGGGARLLAGAEIDAETRRQLERVAAAATTLEWLIEAVFEPAETGDAPVETDLDMLVGHLRHRFAGVASEQGTGFRVAMDPDLPSRLGVARLPMTRLAENMVGAALARAAGGSVSVAAEMADGDVILRVVSSPSAGGAARSPDDASELIVRALADRLGARLDLVTAADGSREARVGFDGALARVGLIVPSLERGLAGVRILLAEDNPTNRMVATAMLRVLEAEVLVCNDGVEALERFETWKPDLLVVDIEMPRLTGLDVIRAVRARQDARAQVPIVALTAYAMREHRDRIIAAGANGLIPKPITSLEAFGAALAAHLPGEAAVPAAEAPTPTPDTALPAIDHAVFDELCRTIGTELVGELMEKVVTDLVDARAQLAAALSPFDRSCIEAKAHILISVAGAFGAARLQAAARALNAACRDTAVPREAVEAGVVACVGEIDVAAGFATGKARHV